MPAAIEGANPGRVYNATDTTGPARATDSPEIAKSANTANTTTAAAPKSANTARGESLESANTANTDEAILQAIANNANTGQLVRSAGLRIEINRKRLANGQYLYFGAYRERNKGRKFAGYIKWSQIPDERKAGYNPRA